MSKLELGSKDEHRGLALVIGAGGIGAALAEALRESGAFLDLNGHTISGPVDCAGTKKV